MITEEEKNILAPLDQEARELNATQFAERFQGGMRLWGSVPFYYYISVLVKSTEYLWRISDAKYDGWVRSMKGQV